MRTANLGKGRRAAGFFRLCLGIIVSLTLATGGMALNTAPVQALDLFPAPPLPLYAVPECQSITIIFAHDGAFGFGTVPPRTTYFHLQGNLPPGSTWNMTTGVLTVCPPAGSNGTVYPFAVLVTSMDANGVVDLGPWNWTSITVGPPGIFGPLVITPIAYQVGWENMPFNMTLAATGCSNNPANYNWACTGLPVGLNLNPANGQITGNPAPGSCGTYTVTVTCTDTSMCPTAGCCPPVTTTFTLVVDCWANYFALVTTYATTSCEHGVQIGPGLGDGQTHVSINGAQVTTLGANGSYNFTSDPCESQLALVDSIVAGPNPQTRYVCIGSNAQWVTDTNNPAYFNYVEEVYNSTGSDPAGIFTPQGAGWHQNGSYFSATAPGTIESPIQSGEKNVFREWSVPGGQTNPNRDLVFTVTTAGDVIARFDTYCLLTLKSDKPFVLESLWGKKGNDLSWNLALQSVPFDGILGFFGVKYDPVNSTGTHRMDGSYIQQVMWSENWGGLIFWIVVMLLAIAAAIYFWRRNKNKSGRTGSPAGTTGAAPPADAATTEVKTVPVDTAEKSLPKAAQAESVKAIPAVSATPAVKKKALTKAEPKGKPKDEPTDKHSFCSYCGAKVPLGAKFCNKCGKEVTG